MSWASPDLAAWNEPGLGGGSHNASSSGGSSDMVSSSASSSTTGGSGKPHHFPNHHHNNHYNSHHHHHHNNLNHMSRSSDALDFSDAFSNSGGPAAGVQNDMFWIDNFNGDGMKNNTHFKILVPSLAAGAIIGKGGETIAHLQRDSGARVKMSKANDFYPGTTERVCLITGTLEAITHVHNFIQDKIAEKPGEQQTLGRGGGGPLSGPNGPLGGPNGPLGGQTGPMGGPGPLYVNSNNHFNPLPDQSHHPNNRLFAEREKQGNSNSLGKV